MVCICEGKPAIRACPPFANRDDVNEFLAEFCQECYGEVESSVDEVNFCTTVWSGVSPECCDYLIVKRGVDEYFISPDCVNWEKITYTSCTVEVPLATPVEEFICQGWGDISNLPDPKYCPNLFVQVGCEVYMTVNDYVNCDLGTCPSTPSTGTAWTNLMAATSLPEKYIAGLDYFASLNLITIESGTCRDDTDIADITISEGATVVIDNTVVGANGLDVGAFATGVWYYVWVIQGTSGVAGLISLTNTPTMPAGYSVKRRIGWARDDNGAVNFKALKVDDGVAVWVTVGSGQNLVTTVNLTGSYVKYTTAPNWLPPTSFNMRVAFWVENSAQIATTIIYRGDPDTENSGAIPLTYANDRQGTGTNLLPVDRATQAFSLVGSGSTNESATMRAVGFVDNRHIYG